MDKLEIIDDKIYFNMVWVATIEPDATPTVVELFRHELDCLAYKLAERDEEYDDQA
jgi:hypothetical protein